MYNLLLVVVNSYTAEVLVNWVVVGEEMTLTGVAAVVGKSNATDHGRVF